MQALGLSMLRRAVDPGRPSKRRTTPPFPLGPCDWVVPAVGYGLSFGFAIFLPLWSRSPWMLIFSGHCSGRFDAARLHKTSCVFNRYLQDGHAPGKVITGR